MKHPISLLALLFGIIAAPLLLLPSVRAQVTWDLVILFGTFFVMLITGAALDYWGDRDPDFWKRVRHGRLFKADRS
jgi:hypothetical protein